jgi:hypothetical protein
VSDDPRVAAEHLLEVAESLLVRPDPIVAGSWSLTATLLIRLALEDLVDVVWARRAPGMERTSMRAQLICLPEYLRHGDLALRVAVTWGALSNACHQHPYQLAPAAEEVRRWLAVGRELAESAGRPGQGSG